MSEVNARQTHINAIKRYYDFVHRDAFKQADRDSLIVKRDLLKNNHKDFLTEHKELLRHVRQDRFDEYDQVREYTEGMYVEALVKFNKQIEQLEKGATAGCDRMRAKSTESNKTPHSTSNTSENKGKLQVKTKAARKVFQEEQESSDDEAPMRYRNRQGEADGNESEGSNSRRSKSTVVRLDDNEERELRQRRANFEEQVQKFNAAAQALVNSTRASEAGAPRYRDLREEDERPRRLHDNPSLARRLGRKPTPYRREDRPQRESFPTGCNNCQGTHFMKDCPQLLQLSYDERWNRVHELNVCQNCFIPLRFWKGEHQSKCPHGNCHVCNQFHNSRLCRYSRV